MVLKERGMKGVVGLSRPSRTTNLRKNGYRSFGLLQFWPIPWTLLAQTYVKQYLMPQQVLPGHLTTTSSMLSSFLSVVMVDHILEGNYTFAYIFVFIMHWNQRGHNREFSLTSTSSPRFSLLTLISIQLYHHYLYHYRHHYNYYNYVSKVAKCYKKSRKDVGGES